jgi:Ca2+-binding EF-hand superfamily protein
VTELENFARCTREEAMRIISGMDSSGDGQIDFDEFVHWWEHAPFAALFL